MIKALSIMELFQVIKSCIRQSGLNFQKCYKPDQNTRAGNRGPRAEGRIIGPGAGARINLIAHILRHSDRLANFLFTTGEEKRDY